METILGVWSSGERSQKMGPPIGTDMDTEPQMAIFSLLLWRTLEVWIYKFDQKRSRKTASKEEIRTRYIHKIQIFALYVSKNIYLCYLY